MSKQGMFYMAGTDNSGEYVVVAASPLGRVGYRDLGNEVRVRLEPASQPAAEAIAPLLTGWKQPDEQFRFSVVTPKGAAAEIVVRRALAAIQAGGVTFNPAVAGYEGKIFVGHVAPQLGTHVAADKKFVETESISIEIPAATLATVISSAEQLAEALRSLRG